VIHPIIKPAPVFSADRLLACGNPAGAFEARRLVHSRKQLCKRTHSAAMRSNFRQQLIASLREGKKKTNQKEKRLIARC
jgi:sRNA-binding protein